jgi:8-oxo-dGTP pyrophosphatase MutT (NUDIX family)/predicted transcriptional regulator
LFPHTREVPPTHPAYGLVDPAGVWSGHEYRPRLYAVTGLNRELSDEPFAVVLFVAPDPHHDDRLAVFVDAEALARWPLLGRAQRALLADRELARLQGLTEDVVQAMPLPPAPALLALVRPDLGREVATRSLSGAERRRLAVLLAKAFGADPAGKGGKVTLDWAAVSAELERAGLGRLRTELVGFAVFDARGRRWTVMFRHTRAELDALIRGRFLPGDIDRMLDFLHDHPGDSIQRALFIARLLNARIRHDEVARAQRLDRREVPMLLSLRALLAQVAGNPGVVLDQVRTAVLPPSMSADAASALLALLAELGLIRVGHGGDTYGPMQWVTTLLARTDARAEVTDDGMRALLGEVAALLASRPALWDERISARVRELLALLAGVPQLGLSPGPDTYLDLLHALAATPGGTGPGEWDGLEVAAIEVLHEAGLVTVGRDSRYRVGPSIRRLLGDLANPDEIDEQRYRRELATLAGLLGWWEPAAGERIVADLATLVARLRTIEGSPLHPDADRGGLADPAPTSYGAVLLAVRDDPGINASGLVTALRALDSSSARTAARRLARLGLVQVTHRGVGGESYTLRPGVSELLTALEDPKRATDPVYRAVLLDLAELLMREQRPALRTLADAVHTLRGMDMGPLESTSRIDDLYELPLVSFLDVLVAIGAMPGSGRLEIALALGASPEFVRGAMVRKLVPRLVTPTRRVMIVGYRSLVVDPRDRSASGAHPARTKFTYELTPLGQTFLAALREPEAALPDPLDRAALHRIALLLRRNPGRDRLDLDSLIDAIVRLLDPADPDPIPLQTSRTSLRDLLDAVAAAGPSRTVDLAGWNDPAIRVRLARLASWGLLDVAHVGNRTSFYRMPEHTRHLLHDLDHRVALLDRRYRRALSALAASLGRPASLQAHVPATRRIEAAIDALRELPESPLPELTRTVVSLRMMLDAVGAAGEAGITVTDLAGVVAFGDPAVLHQRLRTLFAWGIVDRRLTAAARRRYAYSLPEHTVRLLRDLDNRVHQPNPDYLVLLEEFSAWLDRALLLGASRRTQRIGAVIRAIRAVQESPLPDASAVRGSQTSVRFLLDVLDGSGEMLIAGIVAVTPAVTSTIVGHRVATLFAWGLVERRRVMLGGRARFVYAMPEHTRRLLAHLNAPPENADPDYVDALIRLAEWLDRDLSLKSGTRLTRELGDLVREIQAMPASPLPIHVQAPISSYRGTLDAIADAGEAGITTARLAELAGVRVEAMRARLRRLLGWGLVQRLSGAGPGTRVYRLPVHTTKLIVALDNPTDFILAESQERLRALAELLNAPMAELGPGGSRKVTEAIIAVQEMRSSPLPAPIAGPAPHSLLAGLAALGEATDGLTVSQLAQQLGLHRSMARMRLVAFLEWGLAVRERAADSRDYVYRLSEGASGLLGELSKPETHRGTREPLARLAVLLEGADLRSPTAEETIEAALGAVREMPDSPLPARRLHVQQNSVLAMLDVLAGTPDGMTVSELAAALSGVDIRTVRRRLPVLVKWGVVWQARDTRPDGNPRDLVYQLPGWMHRLVEAVRAAGGPSTDPGEQALRDLAVALNNPSVLSAGERTTVQIEIAFDAVRATSGTRFFSRRLPTAPNSVRGALDAIAATEGISAAELAELAGTAKVTMLKRLRGMVALQLVEQRPDQRTGASSNAVVYVLAGDAQAMLDLLDRTPMHPRTEAERAVRALADVLNGSTTLEPGSEPRKAADSAVAAIRALRDGAPSTASDGAAIPGNARSGLRKPHSSRADDDDHPPSTGGGMGAAAPASASESPDTAATESAAEREADEHRSEVRANGLRAPPWLRRILAWFVTGLATIAGAVLIGTPASAGSTSANTAAASGAVREAGYWAAVGDAAQAFVEAGLDVGAVVGLGVVSVLLMPSLVRPAVRVANRGAGLRVVGAVRTQLHAWTAAGRHEQRVRGWVELPAASAPAPGAPASAETVFRLLLGDFLLGADGLSLRNLRRGGIGRHPDVPGWLSQLARHLSGERHHHGVAAVLDGLVQAGLIEVDKRSRGRVRYRIAAELRAVGAGFHLRPISKQDAAVTGIRAGRSIRWAARLARVDRDQVVQWLIRALRPRGPPPAVGNDASYEATLRGASRFPLRRPSRLARQLRAALRSAEAPAQLGTPQARRLIQLYRELIWVVRTDGTVWIAPARAQGRFQIIHTVLSEGAPVLAAGKVTFDGTGSQIVGDGLTIGSRHFRGHDAAPASDLSDLARTAFAQAASAGGAGGSQGGAAGNGAALRGGFRPGEEPRLQAALRAAVQRNVVRPLDPARYPKSPRGPPPVLVLPDAFLHERGLGRLVDHLGAYTLDLGDGPVIFLTEGMAARLRAVGLLGEVVELEVADRVHGLRDEAAHQAQVDGIFARLESVEEHGSAVSVPRAVRGASAHAALVRAAVFLPATAVSVAILGTPAAAAGSVSATGAAGSSWLVPGVVAGAVILVGVLGAVRWVGAWRVRSLLRDPAGKLMTEAEIIDDYLAQVPRDPDLADVLDYWVLVGHHINDWLRGIRSERPGWAATVSRLERLLARYRLPRGTVVYRGLRHHLTDEDGRRVRYRRNTVFDDPVFASTSFGVAAARVQAHSGIILRIIVPAEMNAVSVDAFGINSLTSVPERELLLPRATRFRVLHPGKLLPRLLGRTRIVTVEALLPSDGDATAGGPSTESTSPPHRRAVPAERPADGHRQEETPARGLRVAIAELVRNTVLPRFWGAVLVAIVVGGAVVWVVLWALSRLRRALVRAGSVLSTRGGDGGGLVAIGDVERALEAMESDAETLNDDSRPLSRTQFRHLKRELSFSRVRVVSADMRPAGAEGVLAFGWGRRRVVLVFEDTLAEVDRLIGAGRLPADWWSRLLAHEIKFHLYRSSHTKSEHTRDAASLAAQFLLARLDADSVPGATAVELEQHIVARRLGVAALLAEPALLGAMVWQARKRAASTHQKQRRGPAPRNESISSWDVAFLRELAAVPRADALQMILEAQGTSGPPALVDGVDWRELIGSGDQPMYSGIGTATTLDSSGTVFTTDPAEAELGHAAVSQNAFRSKDMAIGYLADGAMVLDSREAKGRRDADVADLKRAGHDDAADLLADLGVWAALNGIDAIYEPSGAFDRHYLVLNPGEMLIEVAARVDGPARSGDGELGCGCGDRHWGLYGGAGLLLMHRAPDGTVWMLMERRADWTDHGGTWGLLGGARDARETAERAAKREAWEEAGLRQRDYTVRGTYVDDHGDWSYTWVLAEADSLLPVDAQSAESTGVRWVRVADLDGLQTHPGFAAGWPAATAALLGENYSKLVVATVYSARSGIPVYLTEDLAHLHVGAPPASQNWVKINPDGSIERGVTSGTRHGPANTRPPDEETTEELIRWMARNLPEFSEIDEANGPQIGGHYHATVRPDDEQKSSLDRLTGDEWYAALNAWLRGGRYEWFGYREIVTALDSLFAVYKLPAAIVVYREILSAGFPRGPLPAGTIITDHGYGSTSYGEARAERDIVFEILVPRGMNVIAVDGAGGGNYGIGVEREIVLPRGTRLVIESDTTGDGLRRIRAVAMFPVDQSLPSEAKFADGPDGVVEQPSARLLSRASTVGWSLSEALRGGVAGTAASTGRFRTVLAAVRAVLVLVIGKLRAAWRLVLTRGPPVVGLLRAVWVEKPFGAANRRGVVRGAVVVVTVAVLLLLASASGEAHTISDALAPGASVSAEHVLGVAAAVVAVAGAAVVVLRGTAAARAGDRFRISSRKIVLGGVAVVLLSALPELYPGLRGLFPAPFDVFSHVGNSVSGVVVAMLAIFVKWIGPEQLTRAQLRSFRWRAVPVVVLVTAALNAITETRWGLGLPGVDLLAPKSATTPDVWDLIYGAVVGGVWVAFVWRRDTSGLDSAGDEAGASTRSRWIEWATARRWMVPILRATIGLRPTRVGTAVRVVTATLLAGFDTLVATALFLGRPDIPPAAGIAAAVLGLIATAVWVGLARGPPRWSRAPASTTITWSRARLDAIRVPLRTAAKAIQLGVAAIRLRAVGTTGGVGEPADELGPDPTASTTDHGDVRPTEPEASGDPRFPTDPQATTSGDMTDSPQRRHEAVLVPLLAFVLVLEHLLGAGVGVGDLRVALQAGVASVVVVAVVWALMARKAAKRSAAWDEKVRTWAVAAAAAPPTGQEAAVAVRVRALLHDGLPDALLARAPPVYVAALRHDPVGVLGEKASAAASDAELAALVASGLREAVWDAADVAPGVRRLPVLLQGRWSELHRIFVPVRTARAEWEQAGHVLRAARGEAAHPDVAAAEGRLAEAAKRSEQADAAALNEAAAAGFRRGPAARTQEGWRRHRITVLGIAAAWWAQVVGAPSGSSMEFAEHSGQTSSEVTGHIATGTTVSSLAGLLVSALGDRLITTMRVINALNLVALVGTLLLGYVSGPTLYVWEIVSIGLGGLTGGLIQGRLDVHHPVPPHQKAAREVRFQTTFKWTRLLVPIGIVGSIAWLGVPVTMTVLAALSLALSVASWLSLRGQHPDARPRSPPDVRTEVRGMLRQIIGTPRGGLRLLASIPLLAVVTGLPAVALGATMLDQLVVINDPYQAQLATAAAVVVIMLVSRFASLVVGKSWMRLRLLLGTPGAFAALLGRLVGRSAPEPAEISQALLLERVTLLPALVLVPAVWLAVAPGLVPLIVLITVGEATAALTRMPLGPWAEGTRGRSLVNVAKAGSLAVGTLLSVAVLGGYAEAVEARVELGLAHHDLVATANQLLALLAVPVVAVGVLAAHLVVAFRVAPLDDLAAALERSGASAEQAKAIIEKLVANGLRDVGSVRALFLPADWQPMWMPWQRLRARDRRQQHIDLRDDERALLLAALATYPIDRSAVLSRVRAERDVHLTAMAVAQWVRGIVGRDPEIGGRAVSAVAAAARDELVVGGVSDRRAVRMVRRAAEGRDLAGLVVTVLRALGLGWVRAPARTRPLLGAAGGDDAVPGGVIEGGATPERTERLQRALDGLRAETGPGTRWVPGDEGIPLPGVRSGEELFMPHREQVIERLVRDGLTPAEANDLVERVWEFGWRDQDGVDVIAVFENRKDDLVRSGAWAEVLFFARVYQFGGNDIAPRLRGELASDHAQWIVGRIDALPATDKTPPVPRRSIRQVLADGIRWASARRTTVTAAQVEARFGIPLAHQRVLQWFADRYDYVIDVRPSNPDSVRWILQGALPKPLHIKAKSIRPEDVRLGGDRGYVGVVGFFDPVLPERDAVPADMWDAVVERFHLRRAEYAQLRDEMAALDPARFVLGGRGGTVLFGSDAAGRLLPVTADLDVLDIRHAGGRRLSPRELLEVVVELVEYDVGVQHPVALYWQPWDGAGILARTAIIASHLPGREPVLRFAPGGPVTLVDVSTPVGRTNGTSVR